MCQTGRPVDRMAASGTGLADIALGLAVPDTADFDIVDKGQDKEPGTEWRTAPDRQRSRLKASEACFPDYQAIF